MRCPTRSWPPTTSAGSPATSDEGAGAAEAFLVVSKKAKALEFLLARALRGKQVALSDAMSEMESAWEEAIDATAAQLHA